MTHQAKNATKPTYFAIARALAHRNYRLFFFGQGVSLIGTSMQQAALTWLTYQLTNSAFLLGAVAFAGQIAAFVASPPAGVWADRWNRHRTVVATQVLSMIHAVLTTVLVMTGVITVWQIIALSVIIGLINALDMPARQALVVDMIEDRADLGNAIALNSLIFQSARLLGPMVAGALIWLVGEWPCFLINAVSYLAVLAALLAMRISPRIHEASSSQMLHGLREGLVYAYRSMPIRTILLLTATIGLAASPLMVLAPVIAQDILGGKSLTYGLLMGASGFGALGGAAFLAMRKNVLGLGRIMVAVIAITGVATIGVAWSRLLPVSLILMAPIGFGIVVAVAASNTILQTIVDEDKRGRVMSLYIMAFLGTAPFGSLLAGGLAAVFGTPWTVASSGLVCIAAAMLFALCLPNLRESVRPIYIREGILPEISSAIQTAEELTTLPEESL